MNTPFDPRTVSIRPDELAGRVIAITGPTRGIGQALALACAAHGATVVLIGRNVKRLEAVHAQIAAAGGPEATIAPFDLEKAVASDYDTLAGALMERYGRLDGLVHNASMLGMLAPIDHYDVPTWYRVMHVNVTAAFALTHVLLPVIRRSEDASILFTSSGVGRKARAFWGAYAVSKYAIEGLSEILSQELETVSHVRVNTINPGATRTAMRLQAYPSENPDTLPPPEAIVNPYLALLGPASRGITGQRFDAQASRSQPRGD
jgi:NAD(P)-dependent dehydrogenase (short-subunit alcohol dehydrogenase family)